jgi:D-tyrosyl-tRNA(Tyr) deacylase
MKALIQRVKHAKVVVAGSTVGEIQQGLLVFLGIHRDDQLSHIDYLVKKISHLRIFEDDKSKMNLSVLDIGGSVLVVSQFTLYADTKRGHRPDFIVAAPPDMAKSFYEIFIEKMKNTGLYTQAGVFAADMQVSLQNDGPVTIIMNTDDISKKVQ